MRKIMKSFYVTQEMFDALKKLSKQLGIPEAEIVRRGIDEVLKNKMCDDYIL